MAPQEMQKLISQGDSQTLLNEFSSEKVIPQATEDDNDEHVIIVQPDSSHRNTNKKQGGGKGKGSKQKGEGEPRNCVHLEATLFFFGIAGMVVSIVMLLQHLLIKYY
ncbi:unnamed protein product [Orchesella dallaii]|uniref:Uncharacterized protein n=1 Tax=Orchesella dallaii TaxID=48710 RepID=A0ABP1S165_9HEXA